MRVKRLICVCLLFTIFILAGCGKDYTDTNIPSDPLTAEPITSNISNESNPKPDNTEPPPPTEKWEPLILVTTNGETTAPFNHWLWSSQSWETLGWLCADGYPLYMKLPEYADELPAITYSNDFAVQYKENVSFYGLSIFNDSFERLLYRGKISSLDDLSEGTYYISIQVIVLGKYIEKEDEYESQGYECVFKMTVKQ